MIVRYLSILYLVFCLSSCSKEASRSKSGVLKVATEEDPHSLDPRLVRDLSTCTLLHLVYEGLMRTDADGKLGTGAAMSVLVSDDKRTYTFELREANWSDGTPVTANDFEETWKSILSPTFPAPNAYQLYLIKGAKEAKEGRISPDHIGVHAVRPSTLVVELNEPTPYFLEMTSCHFFFPVSAKARQSQTPSDTAIGNGPFKIDSWKKRDSIVLEKNAAYWDAKNVLLSGVELVVLDESTALHLFKSQELDWIGSPLSTLPQDALPALKEQGDLKVFQGAGTHWIRVNTRSFPLNDFKMRQALSSALNRGSIVDHITQGNQTAAIGIVPETFGFGVRSYFNDNDLKRAQELFDEALQEKGISKEKMPKMTFRYAANDRNHKIAQTLSQQWNQALGIAVGLEASEPRVLFDKMRTGDYDLSLGSWYADIEDPINFLEVFKSRDNPTNQTGWQDDEFIRLLNASSSLEAGKRLEVLKEAEKTLIEAMPVIPLFHSSYNYLIRPEVQGVFFSPLGFLDFKYAYFSDDLKQ